MVDLLTSSAVTTMEGPEQADRAAPPAVAAGESSDESGGGSPILTDGDRSGSSSPPSGADMSFLVENQTSSPPTEETSKPSPRKVTIPEHGISSYKALEEGLQADEGYRPAQSVETELAPRSKSSPPKVITMKTSSKGSYSSGGSSKKTSLRRGKWTVEEEAYVARVIQDFNYGYLDAPAGTTLRTYLSEKLKCDPMRITKKFTGDACIGKRVFHPAVRSPENAATIDQAQVSKRFSRC